MFRSTRKAILIELSFCLVIAACGGGSSPAPAPTAPPLQPLGAIEDADPSDNILSESSNLDAPVGITVLSDNPNPGTTTTYTLVDDAGGLFTVDPNSGIVTLSGALDYEVSASHQIVAEARAGNARSPQKIFDINVTDSPAPELSVLFPLPEAPFSDPLMSVTGTVIHPELENITITARAGANAMKAVINPDGTFVVSFLLVISFDTEFNLEVIASHPGGEFDTSTFLLGREPELASIVGLALDTASRRLIAVDRYTLSLVAIELATGIRTLISSRTLGGGPMFEEPAALTLDQMNRLAYIAADDGLFSVDLRSGDRKLVSGAGVGTGPSLCQPTGAAYFAATNSVLVSDDCRKALLTVDIVTGDRVAVTDSGAGPGIPFFQGVTYDPATNRAIVLSTSSDEVYGIDMSTYARTRLDDGSMPSNSFGNSLVYIAVDTSGSTAYVSDNFGNALVELDLATGTRRTVSTSGIFTDPAIGSGPLFEFPGPVVLDESMNRAVVAEEEYGDPLVAVDLATGNRTTVTDGSRGNGVNFKGPKGLATAAGRTRIFVADLVADTAVEVDPSSGDRQLVFGNADGRGTIDTAPVGIAVDADADLMYVADFATDSVAAVSLLDGSSTVIADAVTGTGVLLDNPYDIVLQPDIGRALLLDQGLDALIAIDLASGDRTVLSGMGTGAGDPLTRPVGFDLNMEGDAAYVGDAGTDAIYHIDLTSGDRTIISSRFVGSGPPIGSLADVVFDDDASQLYVLDAFPPRVLAVDTVTGSRRVISGNTDADRGIYFARPQSIELGANDQVLLVLDDFLDALIAVSILTGDRQLLSK